jgi:hypothetical protein
MKRYLFSQHYIGVELFDVPAHSEEEALAKLRANADAYSQGVSGEITAYPDANKFDLQDVEEIES